jgi:Skp family chaperone for outer membrane proteins
MKASRVAWVALAAAAVGVLLWKDSLGQAPAAGGGAGAGPAPGTVAVVDVEEVIRNYSRATEVKKGLDESYRKVDLEMKTRREALDTIEVMLKSGNIMEGSAEYNKLIREHAEKAYKMDAYQKYELGMLLIEQHASLLGVYEDVNAAIAKVAKDRHFKVVLQTDHKMPKTATPDELRRLIQDRKVVFGDLSVDITKDVLTELNNARRTATRPG